MEELETDPSGWPSSFDGTSFDGLVRLRPREDPVPIHFRVSDTFQVAWDLKGQRLRWDAPFAAALGDLALIALSQELDENEIPAVPKGDEYALTVHVSSYLFDIFRQKPPSDAELEGYVRGKIYWTWEFKAEPTRFGPFDARRLRADAADLDQAAFPEIGTLWELKADGYRALPGLVGQMRGARQAAAPIAAPSQSYDVALSFAGEQRPFVNAVATALKEARVSVFYDEFAGLWGKDLSKELERVYRKDSRFVVVFVSQEYVAKAWTNLERQHALAGRMERMDDSVLPARFDPVELPGLPITVGYLDIGKRTPQEVAHLVINKLREHERPGRSLTK